MAVYAFLSYLSQNLTYTPASECLEDIFNGNLVLVTLWKIIRNVNDSCCTQRRTVCSFLIRWALSVFFDTATDVWRKNVIRGACHMLWGTFYGRKYSLVFPLLPLGCSASTNSGQIVSLSTKATANKRGPWVMEPPPVDFVAKVILRYWLLPLFTGNA